MKVIKDKVLRRLARIVSKSTLPAPEKSIVSFSFDDCPASAIQTALPMLEAENWAATIYVACGLCETENHLGMHMSQDDIVTVHARGHEIADHTFSHLSPTDVNIETFIADIERNQTILKSLGIPQSQHFAYPYGHVTPALKSALRTRFSTLRGVISPNSPIQDANLLNAMRIYSGSHIETAITQIGKLSETPQWLHLFSHDVRDNPSDFGCTAIDFQRVISAVKASGARVMTVDQAYRDIRQKGDLS